MTKYNPTDKNHRKRLAECILNVLLDYGYVLNFDTVGEELQFYRKAEGETRAIATVYTSIDSRSGEVRYGGTDAIRVSATHHYKENGVHCSQQRFYRTIHRRGTFKTVAKRLAEALRIANWNIENVNEPRWDGTALLKQRQGGRIRKK